MTHLHFPWFRACCSQQNPHQSQTRTAMSRWVSSNSTNTTSLSLLPSLSLTRSVCPSFSWNFKCSASMDQRLCAPGPPWQGFGPEGPRWWSEGLPGSYCPSAGVQQPAARRQWGATGRAAVGLRRSSNRIREVMGGRREARRWGTFRLESQKLR